MLLGLPEQSDFAKALQHEEICSLTHPTSLKILFELLEWVGSS